MDNKVTLEELKNQVKDFCEQRDWDQFHNPKELAIGISTEANELLQLFRFKSEEDMEALMVSDKRIEVEEELADVLYFVLRFAQMNNIDLSAAVTNKIEKNNKKYPIEKSKGCNKKYDEYDAL
ncbi:MAG: nucleotide pyrophosphohydrolase [Clostridiales bacterium]|nr:nucleotide pyrophosphohydrolase [Clostridiales bacterium]